MKRYGDYGQIGFVEWQDVDGSYGCRLESEFKGILFETLIKPNQMKSNKIKCSVFTLEECYGGGMIFVPIEFEDVFLHNPPYYPDKSKFRKIGELDVDNALLEKLDKHNIYSEGKEVGYCYESVYLE